MKAFYRKTIATCFSLVVLFLTIGPAAAADSVEIRGPVLNGSNIDDIVGDGVTIDATQFAAFSYDINDDLTNDTIKVANVTSGTFKYNIPDVGEGTGEGTYDINTGILYLTGTSTNKGDFTGTYNMNTKEGTITYTDLLGAISNNFTATYDKITNNLAISVADPGQYTQTDLGEVSDETITAPADNETAWAAPETNADATAITDNGTESAAPQANAEAISEVIADTGTASLDAEAITDNE